MHTLLTPKPGGERTRFWSRSALVPPWPDRTPNPHIHSPAFSRIHSPAFTRIQARIHTPMIPTPAGEMVGSILARSTRVQPWSPGRTNTTPLIQSPASTRIHPHLITRIHPHPLTRIPPHPSPHSHFPDTKLLGSICPSAARVRPTREDVLSSNCL